MMLKAQKVEKETTVEDINKEKIRKLKDIVAANDKIIFFGGAGVSTESGIPDFRSKDGLYNQKYKYNPEYLLSIHAFYDKPELFWEFYREKILIEGIKPNKGHLALAKLEKDNKLRGIITQNIDNLHEEAGSEKVFHLHGTILTNHCSGCEREYSIEKIKSMEMVPKCECGKVIKPDVVLYGESLPQKAWDDSIQAVGEANVLIIAGTSLLVYPAASLIDYFKGEHLIIINRDATSRDGSADLLIQDNFAQVLDAVV